MSPLEPQLVATILLPLSLELPGQAADYLLRCPAAAQSW